MCMGVRILAFDQSDHSICYNYDVMIDIHQYSNILLDYAVHGYCLPSFVERLSSSQRLNLKTLYFSWYTLSEVLL